MPKNYMEYNDANTVLGAYANAIKAVTPIEITYAQFQLLTPQQQETGNYIVTDYPGSNLEVVDSVTDGDQRAVTSNAVYDGITSKADKVTSATANNFAALDSNGNLKDSGHKHSDYLTSHQSLAACYQTGDTTEATLSDTDKFPFYDASASGKRHSTWSNIKAKLKTYFDSYYQPKSTVRGGAVNLPALDPEASTYIHITFSSAMPSTSYIVSLEGNTTRVVLIVSEKTTSGFQLSVRNVSNASLQAQDITYLAISY
ncbi:MAG: hypothetical protein J6Y02_02115 [Pseudobutyrivibrio sp.]|nr:hypothetical protein [Pseudobutyrivibrio sp.]